MGVEYRHFLVVADPDWLPQEDTIARVDRVLRDWRLAVAPVTVTELASGASISAERVGLSPPSSGVSVAYPAVAGGSVAALCGPSAYPSIGEAERYVERIVVVAGTDFRIHSSTEAACFTVTTPPIEEGRAVAPRSTPADGDLCDATYPGHPGVAPPEVDVEIDPGAADALPLDDYAGFWRGAVLIDCGKDVPSFTSGVLHLPDKRFVEALSEAFRAPILEVGEFY
jgi:hypothetical protein